MQAIIQGFSYSSVVGIIVAPLKLSPGFSGLENGALVDITLDCVLNPGNLTKDAT